MTLKPGEVSMTKKAQAEYNLIEFAEVKLDCLDFSRDELNRIKDLVHAIDEAEREERGVVDLQEITKCEHCEFFNEEWLMCKHDNAPKERHEISTRIPTWCPRRKENRKS